MPKRAAAFWCERLFKVTVSSFLLNHYDWKCFQTYIFIFEPCKVNNGGCRFKARLTAFAQEHRRNDISTFIPSPFLSSRSRSALHLCLYYLFFRIPPFSLAAHHSVSLLPLVAPIITAHIVICMFSSSSTCTCTYTHIHMHLDVQCKPSVYTASCCCLWITLHQNNRRAHTLLSNFDQTGSARPDSGSCSAPGVKNISVCFISLLRKERKISEFDLERRMTTGIKLWMSQFLCCLAQTCIIRCRIFGGQQTEPAYSTWGVLTRTEGGKRHFW